GGRGGAAAVNVLVDEEIDAALLRVALLGFVTEVDDDLPERQPVIFYAVEADAIELAHDALAALAGIDKVGAGIGIRDGQGLAGDRVGPGLFDGADVLPEGDVV